MIDYNTMRRGRFSFWFPMTKISGKWRTYCPICLTRFSLHVHENELLVCRKCGFVDTVNGMIREVRAKLEKDISKQFL